MSVYCKPFLSSNGWPLTRRMLSFLFSFLINRILFGYLYRYRLDFTFLTVLGIEVRYYCDKFWCENRDILPFLLETNRLDISDILLSFVWSVAPCGDEGTGTVCLLFLFPHWWVPLGARPLYHMIVPTCPSPPLCPYSQSNVMVLMLTLALWG